VRRGGFFGEEGVGAAFDDAAIDGLGGDDAAEASSGFIEAVFEGLAGTAAFSSDHAALRPAMPPPMMAIFGVLVISVCCELQKTQGLKPVSKKSDPYGTTKVVP